MGNSTRELLVIGCAKARRAKVAPLIGVLSERGFAVELVSGLESSRTRWVEAVRRIGNGGTYMLCGSQELPRRVLDQLRRDTVNAGVRIANTWAGMVDWSQPHSLLIEAERLTFTKQQMHSTAVFDTDSLEAAGVTPVASFPTPQSKPTEPAVTSGPSTQTRVHAPRSIPETPPQRRSWQLAAVAGVVGFVVLSAAGVSYAAGQEEPAGQVAALGLTSASEPAKALAEAARLRQEERNKPSPKEIEAEVIEKALAAKRITEVDGLLIATADARQKSSWDDAEQHCDSLDIAGIGSWRLPHVGEVWALSGAKMLRKKTKYWTGTAGDIHGKRRVMWTGKKRSSVAPVSIKSGKAKAVCVRFPEPTG